MKPVQWTPFLRRIQTVVAAPSNYRPMATVESKGSHKLKFPDFGRLWWILADQISSFQKVAAGDDRSSPSFTTTIGKTMLNSLAVATAEDVVETVARQSPTQTLQSSAIPCWDRWPPFPQNSRLRIPWHFRTSPAQ